MRAVGATRDPLLPSWVARADRALAIACSAVRMIRCATPIDHRAELDRITARWIAGHREPPRLAYRPAPDLSSVRRGLDSMAETLEREGPLGQLYADRARELSLEAVVCESAGRPGARAAAARRFRQPADLLARADHLAASWLAELPPSGHDAAPRIRTDDERHPGSLVSLLRRAIGELRLGVRVVVVRDLASLAATGDGTVQVVAAREIDERAARRTVLHEIEGHVLPTARARSMPLGLFAFGTRGGSDDQEGRAVALELRTGLLDHARRRELALRHVAARSLSDDAGVVDTAALLLDRGAPVPDALRIAMRVHRGGGLGREIVYLPALLRYEAAPETEDILRLGRVSVAAAPVLAAIVKRVQTAPAFA